MRKLKAEERKAAQWLCTARLMRDSSHAPEAPDPCDACRADIVRLVDGPPAEARGSEDAPARGEQGVEVTAEDDIALRIWINSQIERCEKEIARTDSNKYVPEDEDDAEGAIARDDLAAFHHIRALLKL